MTNAYGSIRQDEDWHVDHMAIAQLVAENFSGSMRLASFKDYHQSLYAVLFNTEIYLTDAVDSLDLVPLGAEHLGKMLDEIECSFMLPDEVNVFLRANSKIVTTVD